MFQSKKKETNLKLLAIGFAMPQILQSTRGALTTPFQPYLFQMAIGGIFSVALSRHYCLWLLTIIVSLPSSDFPQKIQKY